MWTILCVHAYVDSKLVEYSGTKHEIITYNEEIYRYITLSKAASVLIISEKYNL